MTALAELFTGRTSEPEETHVTTSSFTRGTSPWWAGVPGLDPAIPVGDDWAAIAPFAAMACAVRVFGVDAPYRSGVFKASPASKWCGWLIEATHPADGARRRLALRLICDHAAEVSADDILQTAKDLLAAVSPSR